MAQRRNLRAVTVFYGAVQPAGGRTPRRDRSSQLQPCGRPVTSFDGARRGGHDYRTNLALRPSSDSCA